MKRFERKLCMAIASSLAVVTTACGSGDGTAPDPTQGAKSDIKLNGVILKGHGRQSIGDLASGKAKLGTKVFDAEDEGKKRDILTIRPVGGDGAALECPSPVQCFTIHAEDANITHVFVDVDAPCAPNPGEFSVRLGGPDGELVTNLHDQGGPCEGLDRDVWFPLAGNQSWAVVCVETDGVIPERVKVGAKAKNDCEEAKNSAHRCHVCEDGGPGGAGGAGGEAGAGGSGGSGGTGGWGGSGGSAGTGGWGGSGGSAGTGGWGGSGGSGGSGEAGSGGAPCDSPATH